MRKKLLEAAIKVIAKRGYLGFTTVEAARLAGVTRGAPLHHFRTTDAFLAAALAYLFEKRLADRQAAGSRTTGDDDVLSALMADARDAYFNEDFFTGLDILVSIGKGKKSRQLLRGIDDNLRQSVEDIWRDRLQSRNIPPAIAENIVWLAHSIVRGAAVRSLLAQNPARIEETLVFGENLIRLYLEGVTETEPSSGRSKRQTRK
jgi:AcrR family transcriptional regulator